MSVLNDSRTIEQIKEHGLTIEEVERQLGLFTKGIPSLKINRPATVGDGIISLDERERARYKKLYDQTVLKGLRIMKFVPASGAASRMFRDLETMLNDHDEIGEAELHLDSDPARFSKTFIKNITSFAFWHDLCEALKADGLDANRLLEKKTYRPLIEYTLTDKGLGYSSMPKALIQFHGYEDGPKTSLEEHFHEGMEYATGPDNSVHMHFTVSPEFDDKFDARVESIKRQLESGEVRFQVERSHQLPSTDTIAVDEENEPFLDENNTILFRPGGHGALLHNLNELDSDIVFIKNIDNVVPASRRNDTIEWKKVLAGVLAELRNTIFSSLKKLDQNPDSKTLDELSVLATGDLNLTLPAEFETASDEEKQAILIHLLDRPVRVCGMVRNEGEPGGGPFWIEKEGEVNKLQIVESSQIDTEDEQQKAVLNNATHFNPVDIVCSITNSKGEPINLKDFQDPDTAFIASKSYDGRNLKALERPGLWNGGMAGWITVFIEVPVSTFNPVKTVNDLLRDEHRQ